MSAAGTRPSRIRTLTAAAVPARRDDDGAFDAAVRFLARARSTLTDRGWEIQTVRVATAPLARWLPEWASDAGLARIEGLERIVAAEDALLGLGPVLEGDGHPLFGEWAAEVIRRTERVSFAAGVAAPSGPAPGAVRSAAEAMAAIAHARPGGEGNFRFAATVAAPAGTPFFPAAWFAEAGAFSLGVESPRALLPAALREAPGAPSPDASPNLAPAGASSTVPDSGAARADAPRSAVERLAAALERELGPLAVDAAALAAETGWRWLGIDVSPAPAIDASIGEVIEALSGRPFGSVATVRACAAITESLARLRVPSCGYSGLMLPVLEDPVLARRAAEGRYGVAELLLYSTVCGTGLDMVPLPGDVAVETLEGLIAEVAVLGRRHGKPLAARLLPIPGRGPGDPVRFANPYLTDGVVMTPQRELGPPGRR